MKKQITLTQKQYNLISDIICNVLNAYEDNGELIEEYYNNIILTELTKNQIDFLKKF